MQSDPTALILMYFVLPVWLLAGFADWLCHTTHIESTTGAKESVIHLLMFAEVGLLLLAAIFLELNALVIAFMILMFLVHEAAALWDVIYALTARNVTPIEQHVDGDFARYSTSLEPVFGSLRMRRRYSPL